MDATDQLYRMLGMHLRTARIQRRLTQEDLAAHIGLTRTSINNIEHGRQRIQIHTLYALADILQTRPTALLPSVVLPSATVTEEQLEALLEGVSDNYEENERAWIRTVLADEESGDDGELDRFEDTDPSAR